MKQNDSNMYVNYLNMIINITDMIALDTIENEISLQKTVQHQNNSDSLTYQQYQKLQYGYQYRQYVINKILKIEFMKLKIIKKLKKVKKTQVKQGSSTNDSKQQSQQNQNDYIESNILLKYIVYINIIQILQIQTRQNIENNMKNQCKSCGKSSLQGKYQSQRYIQKTIMPTKQQQLHHLRYKLSPYKINMRIQGQQQQYYYQHQHHRNNKIIIPSIVTAQYGKKNITHILKNKNNRVSVSHHQQIQLNNDIDNNNNISQSYRSLSPSRATTIRQNGKYTKQYKNKNYMNNMNRIKHRNEYDDEYLLKDVIVDNNTKLNRIEKQLKKLKETVIGHMQYTQNNRINHHNSNHSNHSKTPDKNHKNKYNIPTTTIATNQKTKNKNNPLQQRITTLFSKKNNHKYIDEQTDDHYNGMKKQVMKTKYNKNTINKYRDATQQQQSQQYSKQQYEQSGRSSLQSSTRQIGKFTRTVLSQMDKSSGQSIKQNNIIVNPPVSIKHHQYQCSSQQQQQQKQQQQQQQQIYHIPIIDKNKNMYNKNKNMYNKNTIKPTSINNSKTRHYNQLPLDLNIYESFNPHQQQIIQSAISRLQLSASNTINTNNANNNNNQYKKQDKKYKQYQSYYYQQQIDNLNSQLFDNITNNNMQYNSNSNTNNNNKQQQNTMLADNLQLYLPKLTINTDNIKQQQQQNIIQFQQLQQQSSIIPYNYTASTYNINQNQYNQNYCQLELSDDLKNQQQQQQQQQQSQRQQQQLQRQQQEEQQQSNHDQYSQQQQQQLLDANAKQYRMNTHAKQYRRN